MTHPNLGLYISRSNPEALVYVTAVEDVMVYFKIHSPGAPVPKPGSGYDIRDTIPRFNQAWEALLIVEA